MAQTIALAKLNEEALTNMFLVEDLVKREKSLRDCIDGLKKEGQVMTLEAKALIQRNDEMKNSFAVLLDRF